MLYPDNIWHSGAYSIRLIGAPEAMCISRYLEYYPKEGSTFTVRKYRVVVTLTV